MEAIAATFQLCMGHQHSSARKLTSHVLEPVHRFMTLAPRNEEIIKATNEKLVYVAIGHSVGKREVLVRLRPIVVKQKDG